ncbi:Uncharacterised protein [Staphylococcus aureus]|uniref:hypothetical protein n=1 Tax=Staphylococcus aureus TaxID=1280 RepID=UPI000241DEDE|nr:hypothetical protein [Staphylococcus aureus]AEW64658.1 hypothetical protein MS7_0643 [Staphylococcus aureus subsp. aureus 11819-97]CAC8309247.1 Uncharacterised protein [Staphylococcus aureus]HCZ0893112.1 hypothetical protein [Staphylococcus aureus]HDK9231873.1 hypothetical protein [Staphylococcus aureus]HDK9492348.1 hypothetical protein [Staphylococcus aureus]
MTAIKEIIESIEKLFEKETGYKIAKNSGLPYQTVQDLRNGKTSLSDARFRTIIKLYEYQRSLENKEDT